MSKSVSGIRKGGNRSIQDISPENTDEKSQQMPDQGSGRGEEPPRRSRDQRAATFGIWFIGFLAVLLLFFLFSVIFAQTTVSVTPRTSPMSIDDTFTAQPTNQGDGTASSLTYDVVSVNATKNATATSSGSTYKESRAEGRVTISNKHTQESIQLVANTRFEAPTGEVYRTQSAVTVPGMSDGEPGNITVPVVANEPGADYNLQKGASLSIPGFSGTAYAGNVTAESATAIDGGIAKQVPDVSTSTRNNTADNLRGPLRSELADKLNTAIPETAISYEQGRFFTLNSTTDSIGNGQARVSVTGTLRVVTFDQREFSIFLANQSGIDAGSDTNLMIENLPSYQFAIPNKANFQPENRETLEFSLEGNSRAVWQYNKQALARDLQGLQKQQINEVLDNYSGIQSATINTRPFWKRSLPNDISEITIESKLN